MSRPSAPGGTLGYRCPVPLLQGGTHVSRPSDLVRNPVPSLSSKYIPLGTYAPVPLLREELWGVDVPSLCSKEELSDACVPSLLSSKE